LLAENAKMKVLHHILLLVTATLVESEPPVLEFEDTDGTQCSITKAGLKLGLNTGCCYEDECSTALADRVTETETAIAANLAAANLEAFGYASTGSVASLATAIAVVQADIVSMKADIVTLMATTSANSAATSVNSAALAATALANLQPPALDDGLLAKYEFEGSAADSSGNGYTGSQHGGSFVSGAVNGRAYEVSGGSRIEIDGLRNHIWGTDFSVCTWFKRASSDGRYSGIISTGYGGSGVWEIRMGREDGGTMVGGTIFPTNDGDPNWTFGYSPTRLNAPVGQWNHVCMTWDGSVSNYYMNGVLRDSSNNNGNKGAGDSGAIPATSNPVFIGIAGPAQPNEYFNGQIDNVRLYERAVTASDVQTMYADKL
jgi:hypothetical protein